MTSVLQFIALILFLIGALIFSRRYALYRMRQAYQSIIDDFKKKGAVSPETAIEVPYASQKFFRFGLRDYRPKVFGQMVGMEIVLYNEQHEFYLNEPALRDFAGNAPEES